MSIITLVRDKKFQETAISIGLILTLVYEGISVMMFLSSGSVNYISILGLPSTMICIVVIPFLLVAWKIMKGGKINLPTDLMSKPKQQQTKPPFLEVKPQPIKTPVWEPVLESQPIFENKTQSIQGTWKCICGTLSKGNFCSNCGRTRP